MDNSDQGMVWDLTAFFPEFAGPEMVRFKEALQIAIEVLRGRVSACGPLCTESESQWEDILLSRESLASRMGHLSAYVGCLEAAHADREEYSLERGALVALHAEIEKADTGIGHAFKEAPEDFFESFLSRPKLMEVSYWLRRIREEALHYMSPEKEVLASDLSVDGFHAWARLYDKISGKLSFDMVYPDGRTERIPMSRWRALLSDPDRDVWKAAFQGGNRAWEQLEDVCAGVLNAIAGTRLTLYRHRGIDHFLDRALFQAAIGRQTLDAMYRAIHRHIEIPREIFRAKAAFLGRKGIWFFEREAPLPLPDDAFYSWEQGVKTVDRAFRRVYPALSDYFRRILDKRWIESQARAGKRPGAFCTGSSLIEEQRVYMSFSGTLSNLTTLAHEVGHAWHGRLMGGMRPMARRYPMTLAETASVFAEHLLMEGVFTDGSMDEKQKLLMLDADLCGAAVMLLDITTRFEFEKAFHEARKTGEVTVSRLKSLMVESQRQVFGDCLLADGTDPLFWASKLHFYMTGVAFYNFPYTFGFLLARVLIGRFRKEGPAFLSRYEALLRAAGSDTVEKVLEKCLGMDIRREEFWEEGISELHEPLKQYRELLSGP